MTGLLGPKDESISPFAVALLQAHRKVCREELKSAIVGVLDTLMAIEGLGSGEN